MLSDYEKTIIRDVRNILISLHKKPDGWCGHCSYMLRLILGRGKIVNGGIYCHGSWRPTSNHWWLELDENVDPYIVDITGDQFNDSLPNRYRLPDVVMGKRDSFKVYHFTNYESLEEFPQYCLLSSMRTVEQLSFYRKINEHYHNPEILKFINRSFS